MSPDSLLIGEAAYDHSKHPQTEGRRQRSFGAVATNVAEWLDFSILVTGTSVSKLKFLVLLFLVSLALSACNNAQADVPALEQRAQTLNRSIMCPVCPGESIDQSQVALAVQMRGIVDEKIEDGWSDEQIREFFVERYGPSVLLEPPTEGLSLLAWILPPFGLAAAAAIFVLVVRRMRRRTEEPPAIDGDDSITDDELQPYIERIEASVSDE